jgi:hypothetical protein
LPVGELADCEWARGEDGELGKAWLGVFADVGEWTAFLKGKEEASVETGGTGKEGASEAARPKEEVRASGRLLSKLFVLLLFGDPLWSGLCLMFLRTLR